MVKKDDRSGRLFFEVKLEHMFPFVQDQSNVEQRRQLQKQRLQYRVQLQSRQIERVMDAHHLPAQVSGGIVLPDVIQFDLHTQLNSGLEKLKELTADLRFALGVPNISIQKDNGRLQIAVSKPQDAPVRLLDVMVMAEEIPEKTAVLGLTNEGQQLLLPINENHILISGIKDAGKTSILRTIITSLALANRQSQLQQVVIAPIFDEDDGFSQLEPLTVLPHMSAQIAYGLDDSSQILNWLSQEMENRLEFDEDAPTILLIIDNVVELIDVGQEAIAEPLTSLLQRGGQAGIHLILTTNWPDSDLLGTHMKANLPVRIVGKTSDDTQAKSASGIDKCGADFLLGKGDFLLIQDDQPIYFQSGFVGDYDLHMSIKKVYQKFTYSLLAKPYLIRPQLQGANFEPIPDSFWLRNDEIGFDTEER